VRTLKARGADFIKVLSRLDRESYFAIADEAKKQSLSFVGHVPNSIRAAEASAAGQKSIEHIFYSNLSFDCSAREDELRAKRLTGGPAAARDEANASFSPQKAAALWQTFVRNQTWVVPTLVAMESLSKQRELARSHFEELSYLPPALRTRWSPQQIEKELSPEIENWYAAQFQTDLKLARSMHEAGVEMLAGSDSLDSLNFPGTSLHEELRLLVQAGFTPLQALQAATVKPAEFFGATGDWGRIEAGNVANLVLLEANPLEEISNTRKIAAVIVQGRFYGRAELDELLRGARAAADRAR
jgi:imidazolonepropionase-like amidohydrolase